MNNILYFTRAPYLVGGTNVLDKIRISDSYKFDIFHVTYYVKFIKYMKSNIQNVHYSFFVRVRRS